MRASSINFARVVEEDWKRRRGDVGDKMWERGLRRAIGRRDKRAGVVRAVVREERSRRV